MPTKLRSLNIFEGTDQDYAPDLNFRSSPDGTYAWFELHQYGPHLNSALSIQLTREQAEALQSALQQFLDG